nr:hypothetical protein [uncultured Psychroserpens sp.]
MKFLIIFLLSLIFFSCSEETKDSLEPIRADFIGDIPTMMYENQIDSVFEIVTYGKVGSNVKGDTLNYYVLNDNKVTQKLNSLMCCSYEFYFDSLSYIKHKKIVTDFEEYYDFKRQRKKDTIYEIMSSNLGRKIEYEISIKQELMTSKIGKYINHKSEQEIESFDKTTYEYDKDNKLKKKIRILLDDPTSDFNYNKSVTSYIWNQNVLSVIFIDQYSKESKKEPLFTTLVNFDSFGFPISETVLKKTDTIYKTSINRK